jgi:hypothetical protein
MSDTPETDQCVKENKHLKFLQEDHYVGTDKITYENPIVSLSRKLERERDEAVRSCHIWQTGHAELVRLNQPERKHIGRWGSGSNKELFTSPYINQ